MSFEPLLLGLSTGSFCVVSCAPVTVPYLLSERMSSIQNGKSVSLFLLGRLVGYLIFGAVLGAAGGYISELAGFGIQWRMSGISGVVIGLLMITAGFIFNFPHLRICHRVLQDRKSHMGAMIFGILTGLNVCPPFIAAATRAIHTESVFYGMTFFLLFFLGTTIFFIPLYLLPALKRYLNKVRIISRITMILLGFYYLTFHGILVLLANSAG